MEKDVKPQEEVVVTESQWPIALSEQRTAFRKFSVKSIFPYVCGAVIHLRDTRGSSNAQIIDYLKSEHIVQDSHSPLIDGALKKAVKRKILKEQPDGKFKLVKGDCQTIEMLLREHCCNAACRRRNNSKIVKKKTRATSCGRRKPCRRKSRQRKKGDSRKKKRKRSCTKPWQPPRCRRKKKRGVSAGSTTMVFSDTHSEDDSRWNRSY